MNGIHIIYNLGHANFSLPWKNSVYEALHTQGYLDQLLYFAAHVRRVITPHLQCEQGKLIIVGVCVSVYIYVYVCVCVPFL